MVQSLNLQGILAVGQVLRSPSLMLPHVSVKHIGLLDFELLRQAGTCPAHQRSTPPHSIPRTHPHPPPNHHPGIKGIVFDKDNTLTAPYVDEVHEQVAAAFEKSKAVFGAKRLLIISNSAGTLDDPGYEAATRIEASLGVPVLHHAVKKPGAIPEVLAHFQKECGPETTYRDLCIVGDRLLTDVMWGNFAGMYTVHTQILTEVGDNRVAAVVRRLENRACRLLSRRWGPPPHPALGQPVVVQAEGMGDGNGPK